jgi:hypothetical protein
MGYAADQHYPSPHKIQITIVAELVFGLVNHRLDDGETFIACQYLVVFHNMIVDWRRPVD